MITKITLENFFSYGSPETIHLNKGANVIIGANGSGKTNFLKALHLLRIGVARRDLKHLMWDEWGGWQAILHSGNIKGDAIALHYEFSSFDGVILTYQLTFSNEGEKIEEVLKFTNNQKPFTFLSIASNTLSKEVEGYVVVDKQGKKEELHSESLEIGELYLGQLATTSLHIRGFLDYIRSINYYNHFNLSPQSAIRTVNKLSVDHYLSDIGTNLSAILSKIKKNQPVAYEEIQDQLRQVNPQFESLIFEEQGGRSYLKVKEYNLTRSIPLEHLSDGTLHFLLMLSVFYNADRGQALIIEELELGLHPKAVHFLAKAIQYAVEDGAQLFVVTHSPSILNDFEMKEVYVLEKDHDNQTVIQSAENYETQDINVLLGKIWYPTINKGE